MPAVEFSNDGSQAKTIAALTRLGTKAAEPLPVLEESRAILAENERAVFDSEGGTIAEHWAQLSDATVEAKGDSRILVMTGTLRAALSNPGNVHVTATSAELSAHGVPYAHFHESGTSKMPARPFLGISVAAQRALMKLMSRYMSDA